MSPTKGSTRRRWVLALGIVVVMGILTGLSLSLLSSSPPPQRPAPAVKVVPPVPLHISLPPKPEEEAHGPFKQVPAEPSTSSPPLPAMASEEPSPPPSPALMEKVEETKVQEPPPPVSGVGRDKRSRPSTAFAFTVHVESFRERAKAESRVKALQDLGLEAFTVRAELTGKGPYYRILVGRFADRAQANAHLDRLQKEHGLPQGRVLAASEVAR